MHFNLDNKEYSFKLKQKREEKQKAKDRCALCSASKPLFLQQN